MHSEKINEIIAALSKAQGQFPGAKKDAVNPHLKNRYATLDSLIEAIRLPLATNGLSFIQPLQTLENDKMILETWLLHESGQYFVSSVRVEPMTGNRGVNDMQALGSTLTYLRRYTLGAMLGISSEQDDDGNAGKKPAQQQQPQPQSTPSRLRTIATPPATPPNPSRPYSPDVIREKTREYILDCEAKHLYHDAETSEAFPITMHPAGPKTAQIVAAKMAEALTGIKDVEPVDAYHAVLSWFFFGITSANDLAAVEAAALFRILFGGIKPEDIRFDSQLIDVAKEELVLIYETIP